MTYSLAPGDGAFRVVGNAVPLVNPPTNLTANTDTSLTFALVVRRYFVQNNSGAAINVELDAAATAGSVSVPAGATLDGDELVETIHILAPSALAVNGAAAGNVVVKGWA